MEKNKMPKAYAIMWAAFAAAYAIWMVFMKNTVLVKFNSLAERTVTLFKDKPPVVFDDITGIHSELVFWLWAAFSTVCLLLFIVYIKKILYSEPGKFTKYFCMSNLIFAFVFITWYAVLGDRYELIQKFQNVTASMLGLDFPWHFRMWGVFSSLATFTNILYAFRKHNFNSRVGLVLGSIGSAAIFMTINLPSVGEDADFSNPRCLFHWTGALLYAFCSAAPLGIMLFCKMRKGMKKYKVSFIIFIAIVVIMTTLLVVVGKSAIIENLPVWAAYIVLFILNFTSFYDEKESVKEKVTV